MKITMEIPDESVLVTVSIATQSKKNPHILNLGVLPIPSADLKDGNTVDFKTAYDNACKESEVVREIVAREIFDAIDEIAYHYLNDADYSGGDMIYDLNELKKKYTEGEYDGN